jgi:hypothetical protein
VNDLGPLEALLSGGQLCVVEADPVQDLVLGVLEAGEATLVDELALEGRATQTSAIAL